MRVALCVAKEIRGQRVRLKLYAPLLSMIGTMAVCLIACALMNAMRGRCTRLFRRCPCGLCLHGQGKSYLIYCVAVYTQALGIRY
jgi:hypothetical protein